MESTPFRTWHGARPSERGVILVITLMVMAILLILGAAFLAMSATELQIAGNERDSIQALYVAEGGVNSALSELNRNLPVTVSETLGPGQYTVTVTSAGPPAEQRRIEGTGYIPTQASPRAVKRVAILVTRPSSPFQFSLFGADGLSIDAGVRTDSYDSAVGPYDPLRAGSDGDVGSNGNITMDNGAIVNGDATAGGTIALGGGTITGTQTQGAPPVTLDPVDAAYRTPNANGTIVCTPSTPSCYNSITHALSTDAGQTVTLNAGTYYFSSISLDRGSSLVINGEATIYVTGTIYVDQGTITNSGPPTNLTIYSSYASSGPFDFGINIDAAASFKGAIYAPNSAVYLDAMGDVYGSVVGKWIRMDADSRFHFDEALRRMGGSGKFAVVLGSWTEF